MNERPDNHDPVSDSFANFRNGATNMFQTPHVDDVMAAAPARRRRRALGVTVAITTATGITAAGMAVAQNLNDAPPPVADETSEFSTATPTEATSDEDEWTAEDSYEPEPTEEDTSPEFAPAFHFWDLPGADEQCPGGEYEFRKHDQAPTDWELAWADAPWELSGASLTGDVNDDGDDDLVMSLYCEGHKVVAAFDQVDTETGPQMHQLGWVWLPSDDVETASTFELAELSDGIITLQFSDDSEKSYSFDGDSFEQVDEDDPDDDETPTEEPTDDPDESPTEDDDATE